MLNHQLSAGRACAAIGGVFFSQVETADRQLSLIKRLACLPLQ
jgi:hypothetical protein